jgi:hypothetical protein
MFKFAIASLIVACVLADTNITNSTSFYICEPTGMAKHVGTYSARGYQDGIAKYTNKAGISIYRHNGYWYIGDVTNWPPTTHYRCVSDCEKDGETPPLVQFETNAKKAKDPAPVIQDTPCQA